MEISRRQRAALGAICDTFAPGLDGLPSASAVGVPERVVELLERHPRPRERDEVLRLLAVWEHAAKPGRRFSKLGNAERERVLRTWRDSRVEQKRTAYKVLRKATLHHYFGLPGTVRDTLGYPGALAHEAPRPPFEPDRPPPGTELTCDVCVVGSGAGGAT